MNRADLEWAQEEFGHADLGHARRKQRLVRMAARAAERPGGRITQVFSISSEREGAFRAVENEEIDAEAVGRAAHVACARRASANAFAYVPIDGSSLNIVDWSRVKGLGVVGSFRVGATGLQVISAIAVSPDGTPLGVCAQTYWARTDKVQGSEKQKQKRPVDETETLYMVNAMASVSALFAEHAPGTKPWYQIDRGGDARYVLEQALEQAKENEELVTVRACHSRVLWAAEHGEDRYLWDELCHQPVALCVSMNLPATWKRKQRHATFEIRHTEVCLDLHTRKGYRRRPATFNAIHVIERGRLPRGVERVEWMLLTTYPVTDDESALCVVRGYAQRWVIEEFHRTWKTGACNVELTQLRSCTAIVRWATILASVAMRIQRLTKLARTQPDLPATDELTRGEIDAIIQSNPKAARAYRPGQTPTLAEAINWLAEIGGYIGKSSGGPPGVTVITRGFDRIQLLAAHLEPGVKN
jgi:hypothetical protein